MNTRSLKFRLIAWYAAVLMACLVLLGTATYLALQRSLVGALRENQFRRGRQLAQLLQEELRRGSLKQLGDEVEARYAPGRNDRFVRISRRDGSILYVSTAPKDQSLDPAALPAPKWPSHAEAAVQAPLGGGRRVLLATHVVQGGDGTAFLVETGAPMDEVQANLKKWLQFLAALLPLVALVALGGGCVLVKRSLSQVERIAASAERISSHNLSERLPVAKTGDELERLSLALNRMIERLDQAFQYSRRFVTDASHELRTPLTVLRGELESLVEAPQLTTEWRERLGSVLEEIERIAGIVEGLFAISRLDAGEAAAEWVNFDLGTLAAATADQMALLAEDKRIRVSCVANKGVCVQGDRARIKQVVVNLLDNAINYTPEGGEVTLTVACQDGKALLAVTDNGIGIPPEALPRVFERFFRVDKARSRHQGGAGLGLSIVKSICSAHGGRVEASSTASQGSCFRVELPLAVAPGNNSSNHQQNHYEQGDRRAS